MPDMDITRRFFFGAAAMAAGAVGVEAAEDRKPQHGPPAVPEGELPTFRFALEDSPAKVIGGNSAREATVEQLPISQGIAGVSMRLEPGGLRELHWHATAAEWAYVISGRCRTTVIDAEGNSETNDFGPGDVWYFPRGHGHSIQGLGPGTCHFVLVFDNGYFSEFGTFSVSDWIGHTPKDVLSKNLGLDRSAFDAFPKEEVYFARGPVPPERPAAALQGELRSPANTHKYSMLAQEPHSIHRGGREWRVGADRFPISQTITGVLLELDPGGLRELHWHPTADEWQYVIDGRVNVTMFGSHGRYRIEKLGKGDVGYIPQGYGHSIENTGDKTATILIAFNTGHYQAIDLSTWLASNPPYLLAANFGITEAEAKKLPRQQVFIAPKEGAGP
ncbi:MAG TPA: cupin domain-containing protein [Pirellulales bacterium]|nr:cupin domain-containing protein [Pirellulales bacterium]